MLDEAAAVCSRSASQVKLKSLCSSESHAVSQQTLQIHINNGCKKKGRAKQRTKKTLQEREEKTEAVAG